MIGHAIVLKRPARSARSEPSGSVYQGGGRRQASEPRPPPKKMKPTWEPAERRRGRPDDVIGLKLKRVKPEPSEVSPLPRNQSFPRKNPKLSCGLDSPVINQEQFFYRPFLVFILVILIPHLSYHPHHAMLLFSYLSHRLFL